MSAPELKDKEFSFSLRDRLANYCEDNELMLSLRCPNNEKMLLDMIVYCSMGDEEQGLENVRETNNFLQAFMGHLFFWGRWTWKWADNLMWEFWKSSFIRVKMALDSGKKEELSACKDYSRYPRGYAAHMQNFVGTRPQAFSYLEEQTRIWVNDSKAVNDVFIDRQ